MSIDAVIAANRFGLGARPGEIGRISGDPRGWLTTQVGGGRALPEPVRLLPSSAKVFETYMDVREERRESRRQSSSGAAKKAAGTLRKELAALYLDQVAARYRAALHAAEPFRERLVHFWSNHFAVSADKPQVAALAATLENEAIRDALDGRFADMLFAAESHPAMILYLDNQASIGPHSTVGRRAAGRAARRGRKFDINENLAREILELHTLGVNGGYTQTDVTTFALALTGWSIGGGRGRLESGMPGEFVFREAMHEPEPKTILGRRYGGDGLAQPRAVLADLAAHPATAQHLATKLVRHFVADDPPADAVERVAGVFRDSGGDLPSVHRALVELPQAWSPPPAKFKTPHEYVVSAFRMFDHVPQAPQQILAPFQMLGQRPYTPGSPAGWPDRTDRWDGPDALLKRIEWASAAGDRLGSRFEPLACASDALGESLTDRTRIAIARAESAAQGMTLLLASPEFQRR